MVSPDMKQPLGSSDAGVIEESGMLYHFLAFHPPDMRKAWSEVGAIEIGDFVYCYRATFIDKRGLADLEEFLRRFGMQKL